MKRSIGHDEYEREVMQDIDDIAFTPYSVNDYSYEFNASGLGRSTV